MKFKTQMPIELLEQRRLLSVTFGRNLVLNPGAENYDGTADGYNIITPLHWTAGGDPTVARYNRDYGRAIGIRQPDNTGDAFFTGGPDSQSTDLFQQVDLSPIATTVDAGQVSFALSALLGGHAFDDDNAEVFVTFEDASKNALLREGTGSVSASDRDDVSKLITRTAKGTVPIAARFAQVQIHFKRDADGGYNNGFADNIDLVLVTNTASTVGITPSVALSSVPTSSVAGFRTRGAITLTLTNTSSSVNKGLDTIMLLASSDGVVDGASISLATLHRRLNFGAGGSTRLALRVNAATLPAGTYTIFAQTTDSFLTVVDAATGPSIVIAAPVVTLSATLSNATPATVQPGKVITFFATIQNTGNINATDSAKVAIGLSSDGTTTSLPLATTHISHLTVKSGGIPVRLRLRLKVPAGQAVGSYTPFIILTQGTNAATAIGAVPITVG